MRQLLDLFFPCVIGMLIVSAPADGWASDPQPWTTGPAEDWVVPSRVEEKMFLPVQQIPGGIYCIQADEQVRVEKEFNSKYFFFRFKAINAAGVDNLGQLTIDFDPERESVVLHEVAVLRQGTRIDVLQLGNIHLLRRENNLDHQILDGEKTLAIVIKDLRVDDIVQYSYTVRQNAAVFQGRFVGSFYMTWGSPGQIRTCRLLLPRGRSVKMRYIGKTYTPRISEAGEYVEYVWRAENIPPVKEEDYLPDWFEAEDRIQISEFADWRVFNELWSREYEARIAYSEQLEQKIREIASGTSDPQERVIRALHFVQEDIRYTGMEMGAGAYMPRPPVVTFDLRYGDCKDKALLFVAMLRKLDIEAHTALVNSDLQYRVADYLPDPRDFNHVIARVVVGKTVYWLDPTLRHQGDSLETLFQPLVGVALVLDGGKTGLTSVPVRPLPQAVETVKEYIYFNQDPRKAAHVNVETRYASFRAETVRGELQSSGSDKFQNDALNYLAQDWPSLTVDKPMEVFDDRKKNELVTYGHYLLADPWDRKAKKNFFAVSFKEIGDFYRRPESVIRAFPLAVEFPVNLSYEVVLQMPSPWGVRDGDFTVEDPAFRLTAKVTTHGQRIDIHMNYVTLADHVMPAKVAEYLRHMNDLWAHYQFQIELSDGSQWRRFGPLFLVLALVGGIGAGFFFWLRRRSRTVAAGGKGSGTGLIWLGGVYLILIGVVVGILGVASALSRSTQLSSSGGTGVVLVGIALGLIALGCLVAGVGVILRKNWARITLLLVTVFMMMEGAVICLGAVLMAVYKKQAHSVVSYIFWAFLAALVVVLPLVLFLLFRRPVMAERFGVNPTHPCRPIGVLFLGGINIIGAVFSFMGPFRGLNQEMPLWWGVWLSGTGLAVYYVLSGLFFLALGVGMLRFTRWAWWGAVGIYSFWLIWGIGWICWLTPEQLFRMMPPAGRLFAASAVPVAKVVLGVITLVYGGVLVYLWIVRHAFGKAADKADAAGNAGPQVSGGDSGL